MLVFYSPYAGVQTTSTVQRRTDYKYRLQVQTTSTDYKYSPKAIECQCNTTEAQAEIWK